ncbi:tonsoku-like protein [Homarus americanus]|uniref:Tonsoku-like protein-like n=1 Tax=Homarus americanus TaxID=6706 RepID=A0A8J5J685_HOMAM|nr:tonsoku-like protein [Homarus americanus]XP_042208701.1 tonsoku-like protein [Homarus americanus]KAG7153897.1 Tonsoku-like protein-like [Homarus americanus]
MSEITRLEREKRRAESKENLSEVAILSNLLGKELQQAGDYEGALLQYREEKALHEALGNTIGVAVSHRWLGEVYCEMGQWNKALQHQQRHLSLAKEVGSLVEEQRAYATIGRTHLQKAETCGNNDQEKEQAAALLEAEKSFLRSLLTCEHLKGNVDSQEHSQMRCRLYLNLGLVLDNRGNAKKAKDFIGQALELCSSHNLDEDAQRCHFALGSILLREGILTDALHEGQKSLALSTKIRNKALQCENYSFLAHVYLANQDYESAKRCFYKAYKLKHPDLEDRKRIENNLKTLVTMCTADDSLLILGETDGDEKLKLYEKLGDGSALLGLYSQAVEYYQKMLDLAVKLGKDPSFLVPIYLSLGRTYFDNKQYKEAKEFYLKENDSLVSDNYSEACKSLINIAVTSEELGENFETISVTYQQARELAVKANSPKLETYVLRLHSSVKDLPELVKVSLIKDMNRLIEENDLEPEVELSEEETESEDEVDLDLVCFSDSDAEQENFDRPRQSRQKSFAVRRNEKGETPLHKACIDGNLIMVKKLIKQGHPLNPRDNCGWLPLHEAANHGFYDIVLELIEAGAWISDRGGKQCDGITPLHDAAACGNFEVVRLLISKGASVIAKTDEGDTPLESLVKYRMRTKLSQREKEECILLETEIKDRRCLAGHKISELHEESTITQDDKNECSNSQRKKNGEKIDSSYSRSKLQRSESSYSCRSRGWGDTSLNRSGRLRSRGVTDIEEESEDDELPSASLNLIEEMTMPMDSLTREDDIGNGEDSEEFLNPLLEDLYQEKSSATKTYLSAIGSVGSATRRAELQKNSSSERVLKKDKKVALVLEEDYVEDDWLEDDIGIFTKKRKRTEKFEFDYKDSKKEKRISPDTNSRRESLSFSKRVRQTKLTPIVQRYSNSANETSMLDVLEDQAEVGLTKNVSTSSETNVTVNSRSRKDNGSPSSIISGTPAVGGGALRLRVRVKDRLLLVPVANAGQGRTVGWLAEEVTRRYYQLVGLRPHLTLTTQDGAVLDPSDPISLVFPTEQAELQAQVKGWDLPPLSDRYTQACQALGCIPIPSLSSVLNHTETSTTLDLSHVRRLTVLQLHPVLRAIQYQQNLRSLSICNCRLGDDGFLHLLEALPSVPSLEILNLRASGITTSSFLNFTEAITTDKLSLKILSSLDFSYNTFSGAKVSNIRSLFSLPVLTALSLKNCCLSLSGEQQLPLITSVNLKSLSLDYNTICGTALASLLSCVAQVSVLTLSGLNCKTNEPSEGNASLGAALSCILGAGEECPLQHLDLSSCNLVNADLEDISSYLYRCPYLTTINIAHNPGLTSFSVSALLNELTTNIILPLATLSLHGNRSVAFDLKNKIVSTLKHKAATKYAITKLSYSCVDNDTDIQDLWRSQHQHRASISRIGSEVFLSYSN